MGALERLRKLASDPFKDEGDIIDFFLVMGLVVVATVFWSRLMNYIID